MSDVNLSPRGPAEIVLPEPDVELEIALDEAADDRSAVAEVVAANPIYLDAWATLGELIENEAETTADWIEVYAYFRVGYHRGLDQLRKHGWRGSGYVRWKHPANRGFLRCLEGLGRAAEAIGETDEVERCREFLGMLDPDRQAISD